MKDAGYAHMGMGSATGKDKATVAADMAISSPLLETSIDGAKGLIINITASADVSLDDIDAASTMIKDKVSEDANIIWGAVIDDKMEDAISVTVIATGFNADSQVAKKKVEDSFLTEEKNQLPHLLKSQRKMLQTMMTILSMTLCQSSINNYT